MTGFSLERYAENELKYRVRKQIARECRDRCPDGDPMVTEVTVMLGTILAMAAFSVMLNRNGRGRTR